MTSLAAMTMAAFLLAACSNSPQAPDADTSTASASAATAEAEFTVSPKSTCDQLMGGEGNSTFLDTITFLRDITDFDEDAQSTAKVLSDDLNGIAKRAEPDVKALILAMVEPIDGLLQASGTSYKIEPVDFKAASTELLNRCSDLGTDIPLAGSLDAKPSPIATSGDFGADLAAAGTVPESVARFGQFMEENLCQSPLSGISSFSEQVRRLGTPGREASGSGPSVIRLTVAYYCPERIAIAEQELEAHGYTH
jgi:hypothetical protein